MHIAFENLFGKQYEGGANWLEISLLSLGMSSEPPQCLVLGATRETLPETLHDSPHVTPIPLSQHVESKASRLFDALSRRVTRRPWESRSIREIAARFNIDVWVGFAGFEGLSHERTLLVWYPDFQPRHLPEMFSAQEITDRERQWDYVAGRANGILVISESVAKDALSKHPEISDRLYVAPFPPLFSATTLSIDPQDVRHKYDLPERFLLVCNQFWAHKNHLLVLRALKRLKENMREPPVIAFTGRPHDYRNPNFFSEILSYVNSHGLHQYCRFLGVIPRNEQLALIRASTAVIHPSLFEGRGAIVEEAGILGTQVLCSDLPVHRELNALGTIFFPVDGVDELAEVMTRDYPISALSTRTIIEESNALARDYGNHLLRVCKAVVGSSQEQSASSASLSLHAKPDEQY